MAEQQLPVWNSEGVEPPANLQIDGWQPGVKPPAQYFDWLFNRAYKCLEELQAITETLETNKANGAELTTLNNKVTQHMDEIIFYDGVFVNGFTGAVKYGKDAHGIAIVKFVINTIPTITPNTVICTLPIGFKPSQHVAVPSVITNASPYDNKLAFTINPTGDLVVAYNSGLPTGNSLGVSGEVVYRASASI